jgi:hypothetical protein
MRKITSLAIVLTLALGLMLASTISVGPGAFAQKNQTKASFSNSNQKTITPAGKQASKIINQTNIPANKTTTTIKKRQSQLEKHLFL